MDENGYPERRLTKHDGIWLDDLIGQSPAMQQVFNDIETVARADSPVLITGETGTGKELTARAIHSRSDRRLCPFIPINCGAVQQHLLESELFGHERGAFTGAVEARRGRLELADCGTLFLDEVGDISSALQKNLLRVLEEGTFFRLGGSLEVKSDFRLICATHRNLPEQIRDGRFRSDFFYRINVINICIPPLRERKEDIPLLAFHFLTRFANELGKPVKGFSRNALTLLNEYRWPGNVRELKNVMERAVVLSRKETLTRADLTFISGEPDIMETGKTLKEMEKAYILKTLASTNWNISQSSAILGINRSTLQRKLKNWKLTPPAPGSGRL